MATQNTPGAPVSRASWSASESRARRRQRLRCSSNTGRMPPSSRNQVMPYANADWRWSGANHETPTSTAPVTSTENTPKALRTMISTPSSSTAHTISTPATRSAPTRAANRSPSSDGAT
jgi:hypothetical protein